MSLVSFFMILLMVILKFLNFTLKDCLLIFTWITYIVALCSVGTRYSIYVTPTAPVYYKYTFENKHDVRSVTLYITSPTDYYCSTVFIQAAEVGQSAYVSASRTRIFFQLGCVLEATNLPAMCFVLKWSSIMLSVGDIIETSNHKSSELLCVCHQCCITRKS